MSTENLKAALEYAVELNEHGLEILTAADGKRWVADAVGNVAAYLKEQLADQKHITVLA